MDRSSIVSRAGNNCDWSIINDIESVGFAHVFASLLSYTHENVPLPASDHSSASDSRQRQNKSPCPASELRKLLLTAKHPDMKPDQLSVSPKDVPQIHPPSPRSPRLPTENPDLIRGLALKAGWNLQMLQNSNRVPRKCPVLPSFVPRAVVQGLTVSGFDDSKQPPDHLFHGADVAQSSKPGCPFRDHAATNASEKD